MLPSSNKDAYDYTGPTWIIQDTLPHFKIPSIITSANFPLPCKAMCPLAPGIRPQTFLGSYFQPTTEICFLYSGIKSTVFGDKNHPIQDERFNILTISGTWLSQLTIISKTRSRNLFTEKIGLQTSM